MPHHLLRPEALQVARISSVSNSAAASGSLGRGSRFTTSQDAQVARSEPGRPREVPIGEEVGHRQQQVTSVLAVSGRANIQSKSPRVRVRACSPWCASWRIARIVLPAGPMGRPIAVATGGPLGRIATTRLHLVRRDRQAKPKSAVPRWCRHRRACKRGLTDPPGVRRGAERSRFADGRLCHPAWGSGAASTARSPPVSKAPVRSSPLPGHAYR